jgi:hypothetical protein
MISFKVSTWKNTSSNATTGIGYGIRIPKKYIPLIRDWKTIKFYNSPYTLVRSNQLLNDQCPEIRSKIIGMYLISLGKQNWEKQKPHKLNIRLENKNKNLWILGFFSK